jgi:hypothetical protein
LVMGKVDIYWSSTLTVPCSVPYLASYCVDLPQSCILHWIVRVVVLSV